MAREVDFSIKQGDTSPSLEARLIRDGTAVDVRDATIAFRMVNTATDNVIDGVCSTVDPDDGLVTYIWNDGDTDTAGYYEGEFYVDYDIPESLGELSPDETFPSGSYLTIHVMERVS